MIECVRRGASPAVDNTDWLKTAAIILVAVDHFGSFFIENDQWWRMFGRLAAPTFFFLLGFAQSRTVPLRWLWLGVALTLLESWNDSWAWDAPNILLSFVVIRIARPYVKIILQHRGWIAFLVIICALLAVLPIAAQMIEYGSEGWLWALFGLYQRMYVDDERSAHLECEAEIPVPSAIAIERNTIIRPLACLIAAVVYIWQEQIDFAFPQILFVVFILGIGVLSLSLLNFRRGRSSIQPPDLMANTLRFIGRHTLEIYAIQLAGSELIEKFVPHLAAN